MRTERTGCLRTLQRGLRCRGEFCGNERVAGGFRGFEFAEGNPLLRRNVVERHVEIPVHVACDNPGILIPTATALRTFELRCLISHRYLTGTENFN